MADKMNLVENVYNLPIQITENGTVAKTLKTKDTYVDKDIKVEISVADASYKVTANAAPVASASAAASDYLTETVNNHKIVLQANATKAASTVAVNQAGFAAATDTVTVEATAAEQATKDMYIVEGTIGKDDTKDSTKVESTTVKLTEGNTGDFVITASSAGAVKVTKAGWIDANTEVEVSGNKSYNVQAATIANTAADAQKTYTDTNPGAVVSGGYLYINEGYVKDTKISLADIVPDDATVKVGESEPLIYKTVSVYDKDGTLVTGSMKDATLGVIKANDAAATVETVNVAYDEDSKKFNVTGNKAIAGNTSVAIATTGYATTDLKQTGVISGTASVDADLDVISIGASKGEDGAVKPVIAKATSSASSGDVSATAPADQHYVAVNTAAIAKTVTVTPTVTGAGYGDAAHNTATDVTVTAGAEAADTVYIGITNGAVTSAMGDITTASGETTVTPTISTSTTGISTDGILNTAPETGNYITITNTATTTTSTFSGTVSTTVTEGYVTANSAPEAKTVSGNVNIADASASRYIKVYDGSFI